MSLVQVQSSQPDLVAIGPIWEPRHSGIRLGANLARFSCIGGATGSAAVSKSEGCRFESCPVCQLLPDRFTPVLPILETVWAFYFGPEDERVSLGLFIITAAPVVESSQVLGQYPAIR